MTSKKYRNSYKNMHPNKAQHVGREVVLAAMNDSNAANVNERLRDIFDRDWETNSFSLL